MSNEKDLVKTEQLPVLTPSEVVENATMQARVLMSIVEKTGCFQKIADKKYLQVEAWETIGAFNRVHAETKEIKPITREDKVVGYEAHVQLWKDGIVVGGAIMPCYFTENCCKGREGEAKHKASMSAAQTFATSKAYRMNFSYVAILAGYEPLPAEELLGNIKARSKKKEQSSSSDGEFKNVGEFYTACLNQFGLAKSKVDPEVAAFDLTEQDQRRKAWETISAVYGQKPEDPADSQS